MNPKSRKNAQFKWLLPSLMALNAFIETKKCCKIALRVCPFDYAFHKIYRTQIAVTHTHTSNGRHDDDAQKRCYKYFFLSLPVLNSKARQAKFQTTNDLLIANRFNTINWMSRIKFLYYSHLRFIVQCYFLFFREPQDE